MLQCRHKAVALAAMYFAAVCAMGGSAIAAPRTGSHTSADEYQSWSIAAAVVLSARGDANSLATAAALRHMGSKPQPAALDLASRASDLAPQNPSIGWLRLQLCAATPACDLRGVATAMRWVDADNGAAWLYTLAAAQKDKDSTEVDRILADMAHGARFDLYWNRVVVLMVDALHAVRRELPGGTAASDSSRLAAVEKIAGAEMLPPFSALIEACRESSVAPERREPCLKLSKIMQRSDTFAAQLAGFNIEKHLHAPDSKEARNIVERKRVLEWRMASAARIDSPMLPWTKNARARIRLAHMRAMPREEDVCMAILREHKMPLEPPEAHP